MKALTSLQMHVDVSTIPKETTMTFSVNMGFCLRSREERRKRVANNGMNVPKSTLDMVMRLSDGRRLAM